MGDKPRIAMMLCEHFSGATLFAILLDRHPRVSCDGETFPFFHHDVECTCGVNQIDCEYYRKIAGHMIAPDGRGWNHQMFRRAPYYTGIGLLQTTLVRYSYDGRINAARNLLCRSNPGWRRKEADFLEAHKRFTERNLEYKSASVYVDGCKAFRRAALFAESGEFDMRTLHLVRDGRGYVHSFGRHTKGGDDGLDLGARVWSKGHRRADRFNEEFPDVPSLFVRYEDLCRDLSGTLAAVFDFLGVDVQADLPDPDVEQHVLGNRMRLKFTGDIEESLTWQSAFTETQIQRITDIMRPGLERFDYV